MREFVALDVDPNGTGSARRAAAHLTLQFLGEVAPSRNEGIVSGLAAVARTTAPFRLRLEGVGAFPSPDRPRVVWVGVTVGRAEVVDLARRVRAALGPEFGRDAGEFIPHLTLFRVRSPGDRAAAVDLLAGRRPAPPPRDVHVGELLLKESVLGREGAVHRTVSALPFRGGTPETP